MSEINVFFSTYFYDYLRDFLVLSVTLLIFFISSKIKSPIRISNEMFRGFLYGACAILMYMAVTAYSGPFVMYGFSYGVYGVTSIFYLTLIIIYFRYLCNRFSPFKSLCAALFTAYLGSVIWEVPSFFLFGTLSLEGYSQIIISSLIFPAIYLFHSNYKKLIYFIPSIVISIIITLIVGDLSKLPTYSLTWAEPLWMLARISTHISLYFVLWRKNNV